MSWVWCWRARRAAEKRLARGVLEVVCRLQELAMGVRNMSVL